MSILEKLKSDQLAARKASKKYTTKFLTFLLGEIERDINKDTSNSNVIKLLNKVKSNLEKTLAVAYTDVLHYELCIITSYLPEEMSEEDLTYIIKALIAGNPDAKIGELMLKLKDCVGGYKPYDNKLASQIIKKLLC